MPLPSLPSLLRLLLLLLFSSLSFTSSANVPTHQHQGRAPRGTAATLAEVPDADVRSSFQVFDTDDDGYLSAKEVRAALGALAHIPGGAQQFEARSFVDLGDEDGDGSLSLREFALALHGGKQETKAQQLQRQQQQKAGAQQRQRQRQKKQQQQQQQQRRHVSMDLTAQKASASVNGLTQLLEVRSTIRRRSSLPSQTEGNEADGSPPMLASWDGLYAHAEPPMWDAGGPDIDLLAQLPPAPASILEIGCGEGHDALYLASLGHTVTCIEYSSTAVAKLPELRRRVRVLVGDVTNMDRRLAPLRGTFDAVFMRR